jgi:hypothetical protein
MDQRGDLHLNDLAGSTGGAFQRHAVAPAPRTPSALGAVGHEPLRRALRERPRQRGWCCRVFSWLFRE